MTAAHLPNICLIGKAGAGKDTVAGILSDVASYQRYALADPLKDIAATIWGPSARSDRAKLQGLGVAVRVIDPDAWLHLLLRRIDTGRLTHENGIDPCVFRAVVTDCRFHNEADALRQNGYAVVRVTAARAVRANRLWMNGKLQDEADLDHVSETELDHVPADYTLDNGTTPGALGHAVIKMLNRMRS